MRLRRTTAALIGAAFLALTTAATAPAAVSITSFAAEPTSLTAGGSPDLPLVAELATSDDDDVKDLTVSLAPGVAASLGAVTPCTAAQFSADSCPAGSQIGGGSVTAAAPAPLGDVTAPARMFVVEPAAAGALPRIGLDIKPTGLPRTTTLADVAIRPADAGVDIVIKDLPREVGPAPIFFKKLDVKIDGTVGGAPFTRMATACTEIKTRVSLTTYAGATATAEDPFTATGCDALGFAPKLAAAAAITPGTDGVELTSVVTQGGGESAQKKVVLSLPSGFAPRLTALSRACPAATDINACPATATVGAATATTPLLPGTLTGKIVLKATTATLPTLSIVFPAPVPLRLDGSTQLTATGMQTTFDGIPDVPIANLTVRLNGGADSVLQATPALCTPGQAVGGAFTAHSGKAANVRAPLAVTGTCQGGGGTTPPPPPPPIVEKLTGKLSFSSIAKTPKLVASLTVPRSRAAARKVKLSLPSGLTVVKRRLAKGLAVVAGGKRVKVKRTSTSRSVTITLPSAARSVKITLSKGALKASASLKRKVKAKRGGTLKVMLRVTDSAGKAASLSLRAKAR